jgi:hypothetical protein
MTLYWRSDAPISQNYDLSLNGLGFHEENVAKLDTWPGGGLLPTQFWQQGVIYPDHYLLATTVDADTPSLMRLSIRFSQGLIRDGVGVPLPALVDEQPVEAVLLDAGALCTPEWRLQSPASPPIALLDQGVRLHKSQIDIHNDAIDMELIWSATQTPAKDYTIFVHLIDAEGHLLGQGDAPPRAGYWPTSHWHPGEAVASWHTISLPNNLSPGDYTLLVGMYDPASGQRLAIRPPEGGQWPNGAMPMPITISH